MKPEPHGLWSTRTTVTIASYDGVPHPEIGIVTVTTPDFAVKVEPVGSGGNLGLCVTVTFGLALAPPVYFSGVMQPPPPALKSPEHVPVVAVKAICRNTRIEVGAPAAPPAESSTRTMNEKLPPEVGLPVVLPPVDNARPGGSAPPSSDHLYGFTPPAATRTATPYVTPTSPMWNGNFVMISFAGLGAGLGEGETSGVAVTLTLGVGAVLGVGLTAAAEGVDSGELVACWLVWVQPANIKTSPATSVAGTPPPLIPRP
jgi:hypothetical protein